MTLEYDYNARVTPAEARKVLAKAKREGKRPHICFDMGLPDTQDVTAETYNVFPMHDSIRCTWTQVNKYLSDIEPRIKHLSDKGRVFYIPIRVMDRCIFIG